MNFVSDQYNVIGRKDLEVGQWIQFSTQEDVSGAELKIRTAYEKNQRFLVISREDESTDLCRCYVVNMKGSLYDYNAETFSLGGYKLVENSEIRAVSKESVHGLHGIEKVQKIYQQATKYINTDLAEQFKKHPAHTLGKISPVAKNQRRLSEILREQNLEELRAAGEEGINALLGDK